MDHSRLQLATRIHYLLAQHLGDGIDVGAMLAREDFAREVLIVCDASDVPELQALAAQYRAAPALDLSVALRPAAAADAPQDAAWAQDTSGFGISQPGVLTTPKPAPRRRDPRWYDPSSWFGGLQA